MALSECGCNACHSGPSEWCEAGPEWHAEADRQRVIIAQLTRALGVWAEAFDTGRSEPLFVARDYARRVVADIVFNPGE